MNKKLLAILGTLALFGFLALPAEADVSGPFGIETNGLQVTHYDLDSSKFEIILQVEVYDSPATLETTFDRDFFDSRYLDADDDFVIIADGDRIYYEELENNSEFRTIMFSLNQGTNEVEIFGTHMNGLTFMPTDASLQEESSPIAEEEDENAQLEALISENEKLAVENKALKEENKKLDGRIFELENLVSALDHQVNGLKDVVSGQVKVMLDWLGPKN